MRRSRALKLPRDQVCPITPQAHRVNALNEGWLCFTAARKFIRGAIHRLQRLSAQENNVRSQTTSASDPATHRRRVGRVKHQSRFGIGERAAVAAVVLSRMEAECCTGSRADLVVRKLAEENGACGGTEAVNDHTLAR
jgi:hypothetical protein